MAKANLTVQPREETGKQAAKRLRRGGWVPATLYGDEKDPVRVKIERKTIQRVLHEAHLTSIVDLIVEGGETAQVLLREPVVHPLRDELLHIDLMRVSARSRVRVDVPIEPKGSPKGVLVGGILDQVLHTLPIECRATAIPETIEVDVSQLEIGDNITASELNLRDIHVLVDPGATVFIVAAPRVEEELEKAEELEAGEEPTEPELVGRERGEEEEGEEES